MKTRFLSLLFVVWSMALFAQGTVNFINIVGTLNAPDFMSDGTTKISGAGFTAELMAGTSATYLASVAQTGFLTGAAAGYFNGGTVTLAGIAPGATGFFQVRIFATVYGSFAAAQAFNLNNTWAQSSVFSVVTGGAGTPPSTPAPLTGLTSMTMIMIPEPSTAALVGLGAVLFLVTKKNRTF